MAGVLGERGCSLSGLFLLECSLEMEVRKKGRFGRDFRSDEGRCFVVVEIFQWCAAEMWES